MSGRLFFQCYQEQRWSHDTDELQSKLLKEGYVGDYIGDYYRGY